MANMMTPTLATQLAQSGRMGQPMQMGGQVNMGGQLNMQQNMGGQPNMGGQLNMQQNMGGQPHMGGPQNMGGQQSMSGQPNMGQPNAQQMGPGPRVDGAIRGDGPRVDSGPDSPDAWKCPKCDNFNYGGRRVCNMRKCATPKPIEPWTCPSCGNDNHANRPFCNMRSCGLAKPGLSAKDIVKTSGLRGDIPGFSGACRPVNQMQQMQQMQMFFPGGLMGAMMQHGGNNPPGSWACTTCGNINWPTRSVCNGKKGQCGLPRGAAPAPEGAWICSICQNVNWPERTHCNKRSCGAPRGA